MANTINKARIWCGIGYPENMIPEWEQEIGDIYQIPYAYCIHDKDTDKAGDARKAHVHIMLVWSNPTTYKHALSVFNLLSVEGKSAFSTCEAVIGARNQYEYLIHNTENAKKQNKHQYAASERITGNSFDIGAYEQLGVKEKNDIAKELCDVIIRENFTNFRNFYMYVASNYDIEYFSIIKSNSGLFDRLIKGNYHEMTDDTDE